MSDVSQIDGNAVRLRRESLSLGLADVATRACLSVKQVRQIEEGGLTAFYSETVKLTAARKVAGLLSLPESELFGQIQPQTDTHLDDTPDESLDQDVSIISPPVESRFGGGLNTQHAPITRSEALHVLAQPPEHLDEEATVTAAPEPDKTAPAVTAPTMAVASAAIEPSPLVNLPNASSSPQASDTASSSDASAPKDTVETPGSGYLLKILALFIVALAAAALLKPKAAEDLPAPPPAAEAPAEPTSAPVPPVESNAAMESVAPPPVLENKPLAAENKLAPSTAVPKTDIKPAASSPSTPEAKPETTPKAADAGN
jgi:transcriptional regulator with XRE-family HTH domain